MDYRMNDERDEYTQTAAVDILKKQIVEIPWYVLGVFYPRMTGRFEKLILSYMAFLYVCCMEVILKN